MNDYGFSILPEEVKQDSEFDEGEGGTLFVEVSTFRPPHLRGKLAAVFYYRRNFAKWNAVTEEGLKKRFPKSYKQGDTQEEYCKAFNL